MASARTTAGRIKRAWRMRFLRRQQQGSAARVMGSGASGDSGGCRGVPGHKRGGATPDQLDASKDGDGGDDEFELARRNDAGEGTSQEYTRHAARQQLQQHGSADGAKVPMERATDDRQDQAKDDVGADDLRRGQFRGI